MIGLNLLLFQLGEILIIQKKRIVYVQIQDRAQKEMKQLLDNSEIYENMKKKIGYLLVIKIIIIMVFHIWCSCCSFW